MVSHTIHFHWSVNQSLGWTGQKSARFTPLNNFFILHNTYNNNTQQEVPSTLGVSVSIS
jgi:hypothetical protein